MEKSNKGWGVGLAQNRIISESGWMKTALTDFNVIVSHQDQVTVLSEGATIIATSDFCPNFMVQWSPWLFSIQGHPEWSKAYSIALVNDRRDRIPVDRVTRAMASYDLPLDADQVVKWILQFAS